MRDDTPIIEVKGIGAKTEKMMHKIGVYTVGDILLHYPSHYIKFEAPEKICDVTMHQKTAVCCKISRTPVVRRTRNLTVTISEGSDGTGRIELLWYRQEYIKNQLHPGEEYVFYGKISWKNNRFAMEQPEIYTPEQYQKKMETLQPVYGKTEGLSNQMISKTVRSILEDGTLTRDFLPQSTRERYHLAEYNFAIEQIHYPESFEKLTTARRRLVFDEFFLFLLNMQYQKERTVKIKNEFPVENCDYIHTQAEKLPYELTNAQQNCLKELIGGFKDVYVMQRLIQGDVGSGKTIIAFLCMVLMAENGYQSALMAPTEVLARQHYETFTGMCEQFEMEYPMILLTGSLTAKEKREAYEQMQLYPNAMIIGTQALIQEKAEFRSLALVITDEQHRFGVKQRETLAEKGFHPHILGMSATPIPRTLAIILYGDMDISVIDEVPAKRLPIKNCVVDDSYRKTAYQFLLKEVQAGHQAYIICPLVEESEGLEAEDVVSYEGKIREAMPKEVEIAILHGKMKAKDKNQVMEDFAANKIQILISTTVVEVGVNVPNATVMMIENAERFGLAQLHQLRGRVGRGEAQSYCIMVNGTKSKAAKKRLEILNKSNDGFFIASEDLKLRGPGDFFGIRQSGDLAFKLADIYQDQLALKDASVEVKRILEDDPELVKEENEVIQYYLLHNYARLFDHINL